MCVCVEGRDRRRRMRCFIEIPPIIWMLLYIKMLFLLFFSLVVGQEVHAIQGKQPSYLHFPLRGSTM